MKANTFRLLGCLVLGLAFYAMRPSARDSKSQRGSGLRAEPAPLPPEVAAPQVQYARASAEPPVRSRAAAPSPSAPFEPGAAATPLSDAQTADSGRDAEVDPEPSGEVIDVEELLLAAFVAQPDEPSSSRAEKAFESRLRDVLPEQAAIESIECRAQFCRLTTVHRSEQEVGRFHVDAFKDPTKHIAAADAFTFVETRSENELFVVTYFPREGQILPSL